MIVPGKKIWKVQQGRTQRLAQETVLDTGDQNFTPDQVGEKVTDMAELMSRFMPAATGAAGHDENHWSIIRR